MQVLLLSNGFQSEYEAGFANGLARMGGVDALLLSSDSTLVNRLDANVKHVNLRGSQDPKRSRMDKAANILRYVYSYLRLVRRSESGVAHVIGLFSLRSPLAHLLEAFLLRAVARRFILTAHDLLPHDRHTRLVFMLCWLLYRLPDVLVVHTRRAANELSQRFGVPASRIVFIEHGVDRLQPPEQGRPDWLHQRLGLAPQVPVVLFFGAVSGYKGVDLLIDAFADVVPRSDAVLVIAGSCRDESLRHDLRRRLAPLQAKNRAHWFDEYVPDDHVAHYFHGASLLVMPYRHIDQSGVLFMALSTGLPVVATDVGALRDYVPMTGGAVVPPGSAGALATAILEGLARAVHVDRSHVVEQARQFLWAHTLLPLRDVYDPDHRSLGAST